MFETVTATIHITCPFCQQKHYVENVSTIGFDKWLHGESIQRALPELTPTQREQLISQLCPDCQRKVFEW